jgi:DNA-directed RNA polymerase subunit RPC12/RpoP
LGNIAARIALNVKLKELTTFYRVFDVRTLRDLPLRYINADGYSYGVQIIYYLRKGGVELREVPINFIDRTRGRSKIPRIQILLSAFDLLKLAAQRLKFSRDLSPDVFVEDVCINCGDRVLAMQSRNNPTGYKSYKCLRCDVEQVPVSTQAVK